MCLDSRGGMQYNKNKEGSVTAAVVPCGREITMRTNYHDIFKFDLPTGWEIKEEKEQTILRKTGERSFLTWKVDNSSQSQEQFEGLVSSRVQSFLQDKSIELAHSIILDGSARDGKRVYCSEGNMEGGPYIRFWVVFRYPMILTAYYKNVRKTIEVKKAEHIINSITFPHKTPRAKPKEKRSAETA